MGHDFPMGHDLIWITELIWESQSQSLYIRDRKQLSGFNKDMFYPFGYKSGLESLCLVNGQFQLFFFNIRNNNVIVVLTVTLSH